MQHPEELFSCDMANISCSYFWFQAANNFVVITRDDGGPESIVEMDGINRLRDILNKEKDTDILHAFIRTFACLAKGSKSRVRQKSIFYLHISLSISAH